MKKSSENFSACGSHCIIRLTNLFYNRSHVHMKILFFIGVSINVIYICNKGHTNKPIFQDVWNEWDE